MSAGSGVARAKSAETDEEARRFRLGLARAYGGAVIFALPVMMTMELWWLGFYMNRWRLLVYILAVVPLLVGLSRLSGIRETYRWRDDVIDALVAISVGATSSAAVLMLMSIIGSGMTTDEVVGKIALQSLPAAIGALVAQSEFGSQSEEEERRKQESGYAGELFLMLVGAIYLGLTVAPTEEMILIAYRMSDWHAIALLLASLLAMHAIVYAVEFRGQAAMPGDVSAFRVFLRFTVVGYAIVLLASLYMLWVFGRTDGVSPHEVLAAAVVLGLPGSLGAAAARLII